MGSGGASIISRAITRLYSLLSLSLVVYERNPASLLFLDFLSIAVMNYLVISSLLIYMYSW
jgi:hypothetical protein